MNVFNMKKNNKFRNNASTGNTANIYSINYKFDSISPAGKVNGTALDLIKKYNELAKEAHGSGDYIEMEVYRQYAEHYRKIVTEINERRSQRQEQLAEQNQAIPTASVETGAQNETTDQSPAPMAEVASPATAKREFKIVEINRAENLPTTEKPRRITRTRKTPATEAVVG